MHFFSFRKTAEKDSSGNQANSATPESQVKVHVNGLDAQTHSTVGLSHWEKGITTVNQEHPGVLTQPNTEPEYPHGVKLAIITFAVALSVFLVALIRTC